MKKLMQFCFAILLIVLSVLSCLNFSIVAQEQIELDKTTIQIMKPDDLSNADFLTSVDEALATVNADIMFRYVRENGGKTEYCYFKTNHTEDFLAVTTSSGSTKVSADTCISTRDQDGFQTITLRTASLLHDLSFFTWEQAAQFNLSSGSYYVKTEQVAEVTAALNNLGYAAFTDNTVAVSTQFSIVLFAFIPAFMVVVSMVFYTLSNGKKNVLKKMEGYTTASILLDEAKQNVPVFALCFIAIEAVTLVTAAILYWNAFAQFVVFFLPNMVVSIVVLLVGCLFSALFIVGQKSAEHIKGRVPKRGIYTTTIIAKCAFIVFMMFFLTMAVRNVATAYNTFRASQSLADKVQGYVTVPINNSNISYSELSGMNEEYEQFYMKTVDRYNAILIDSSSYHYDLISGTTEAEEYGVDYIMVNRNYLEFNPVYSSDGIIIGNEQLSDSTFNVLIPKDKLYKMEEYKEKVELNFHVDPYFITYDSGTSKIYSYNANTGDSLGGTIDSPIIMVVDKEYISSISPFVQSWCSQGCYFLYVPSDDPYAELRPILEETGVAKATISTPSVVSTFAELINQQVQMLLIYGTEAIVLIIGLFCLIVFSSKLYCENYKRKIACCLIEGHSLVQCIKKHLTITICYYVAIGILLSMVSRTGMYRFDLKLLLVSFICELAIIMVTSSRFTTQNLYQIVKGAE